MTTCQHEWVFTTPLHIRCLLCPAIGQRVPSKLERREFKENGWIYLTAGSADHLKKENDMSTKPNACYPRRKYETQTQASTAARAIVARGGVQRLPEPCQHCNGWHLR